MIDLATASDPKILEILRRHPKIARVEVSTEPGIAFTQGTWHRSVRVNDPDAEIGGLIELMDNNPLVCADKASVPSPVATLALIALGPLAVAGIIADIPAIISSVEANETEQEEWLARSGWSEGGIFRTEAADLGGAVAVTVMVEVPNMEDFEEIDALYAERYSRSFYVRRDETSEWHVNLVLGQPFALYRLRLTPGEITSLLTVQVIADDDGKCGAAQMVHVMNVMAGFEESQGIA